MPFKFLIPFVQNCIDQLFLAARNALAEHGAFVLAKDQRQERSSDRSDLRLAIVVRGGSVTLEWRDFSWKRSTEPGKRGKPVQKSILKHDEGYLLRTLRRKAKSWEVNAVMVTEMRCRALRARLAVLQKLRLHFANAMRALKVTEVEPLGWSEKFDLVDSYIFHGKEDPEMPVGDRASRGESDERREDGEEWGRWEVWGTEMAEDIASYLQSHLDQQILRLVEEGGWIANSHNKLVRENEKEHYPDYAHLEARVISARGKTRFEWVCVEFKNKNGRGKKQTQPVPKRRRGEGYLLRTLRKYARPWEYDEVESTERLFQENRQELGVYYRLRARVDEASCQLAEIARKERKGPDLWQNGGVFATEGADPLAHFRNQKVKEIDWK